MCSSATAHRRALHRIPELDNQLLETTAYVRSVLEPLHCQISSPIPGSVCAWFDAGQPETTVFRADMDALPIAEATGLPYASEHPGVMHACGHDGHTAMLLALAEYLSPRLAGLPRNVLLLFQPSEETTGGALKLCQSGILERCRAKYIFGLHLWPGLAEGQIFSRPGPLMARSNEVTVRIIGKSVHLSKAAQGRDALMAGVDYLQRACRITERPPCVLRFGKMTSGTVRNAVSGNTVLEGSLRTYREETFQFYRAQLQQISGAVAEETGCHVAVELSDGYPAVWNDESLYEAVCTRLGADAPQTLKAPVLAAEDFSFYQQCLPGVFFFLGVGDTAELHSPSFCFYDEAVLPKGVSFLRKLLLLV